MPYGICDSHCWGYSASRRADKDWSACEFVVDATFEWKASSLRYTQPFKENVRRKIDPTFLLSDTWKWRES